MVTLRDTLTLLSAAPTVQLQHEYSRGLAPSDVSKRKCSKRGKEGGWDGGIGGSGVVKKHRDTCCMAWNWGICRLAS